jgi:hypothetical protein
VYAKKSLGVLFMTLALSLLLLPAKALGDTNSLTLDQTNFAPGEPISVHFTAEPDLNDTAWVGIVPSNIPHGSEVTNDANDIQYWQLVGQTSGVLTLTAPSEPGAYDLRMNDTDYAWENGKELASVSFTVSDDRSIG